MAFNSKQYAFADVSVIVLGRTLEGFRGVKYTVKVDKEYARGRGRNPMSIQSGDLSVEGELMMLQSEVEALRAAVKTVNPTYKLTDISFDIVVTYGDGATSTTDTILGCEFTEYEKGMSQGDLMMEVSLKYIALDVQEGA